MYLHNDTLLQGGKYKIVRHISSGGFGNTYEGELQLIHRRVAIKEFFVKDFCNRDEQTSQVTVGTQSKLKLIERLQKKFLEEAGALYSMQHPHIVRVTDVFEENGTAYYVMDYVDGESLQQKVKNEGALPEATAVKYIKQIADALKYVHSLNRLHLDIKPGNIMIDSQNNAILIDFGASKQYDDVDGENTSTLLGKTPGYAPIEQMGNSVRTFTPASDIYALGATLYKLLTGITPPDSTLLASGEEIEPIPSTVAKEVCNAVGKAMQTNKALRPQSMEEFLDLLSSNCASENNEEVEEVTVLEVATDAPGSGEQKAEPNIVPFEVKGVKFNMIRVEGGTFDMKETVPSGFFGLSTKEIVQKTTLSDYYIGETEVTQELWRIVMGSNPSGFKGDDLPVECINWEDCQIFISKLNSMTGRKFRLPTEAEWEFAARGGNKSKHYKYSGSDNVDDVAWHDDNSKRKTHPVATKKPNELGIYDMSGNVWEWCNDWEGSYNSISQYDPTGPSEGSYRVYRGGSWNYYNGYCATSNRSSCNPYHCSKSIGLRLALY